MKRLILSASVFIAILGTTSCVKDWQCECTDGTSTNVVENYPNTKLLDAKKYVMAGNQT